MYCITCNFQHVPTQQWYFEHGNVCNMCAYREDMTFCHDDSHDETEDTCNACGGYMMWWGQPSGDMIVA